jgi:uncharacterized membrane protein YwzB
MNLVFNVLGKLDFLQTTLLFYKKHFLVITGLGLIAASGRVIQLGGFGEITALANILLEIVVESARIFLCLYVLGLANIRKGFRRITHFFTHKEIQQFQWNTAIKNVRKQWLSIVLNFIAFALIAWVLNYFIDLLAYETCLYLKLKTNGILAASSSEWTVILFFKNLSVIPFTLIFETLLVLWLTNKISSYTVLSLRK